MTSAARYWDSVDPGVSYYARARWEESHLVSVSLEPIKSTGDLPYEELLRGGLQLVVMELPREHGSSQAQANDILDLAFAAGLVCGRYYSHVTYTPGTWKGQVPKAVHHPKIMASLTQDEKKLLAGLTKTSLKHIMDAVGLGLYHLKRIGAR